MTKAGFASQNLQLLIFTIAEIFAHFSAISLQFPNFNRHLEYDVHVCTQFSQQFWIPKTVS